MRAIYLYLISSAIIVSCYAAVSEEVYEPDSEVEKYSTGDFKAKEGSYWTDIATNRVAPLMVVGILLALVFFLWSCFMCCGCCKPKDKHMTDSTRVKLTIVALILGLAGVGILIYGFSANKAQHDALSDVPGLIDNLVVWKQGVLTKITNVKASFQNVVDALDAAILSGGGGAATTESNSAKNIINTNLDTALDDLLTEIDKVDFEKIRDDLNSDIKNIDDQRSLVVTIFLVVLLVYLLLQLFISITATFSHRCPPRICLICVQPVLTIGFVFIIFLCFFVCGILLGLTTVFADFCKAPNTNIIDTTGLSDDQAIYYIRCQETGFTGTDPLATIKTDITTYLNQIQSDVNDLTALKGPSCNGNLATEGNPCPNFDEDVDGVISSYSSLRNSIDDPNSDEDLFSLIECKEINGKYQAILNTTCGSFFDALRKFFEVLVAFASIMALSEILRRFMPRRQKRSSVSSTDLYNERGAKAV